MKSILLAATALLVVVASAGGKPVAMFTPSTTTPRVGQTVTFDGTASVCDVPPCSYEYTAYRENGTRIAVIGRAVVSRYAFGAAQRGHIVSVVLKVTSSYSTHPYGVYQANLSVRR